MKVITSQSVLDAFCAELSAAPYVTVDTEFLRERTYWPVLCLVQLAGPGEGEENAAVIDPLAEGLDLAPLYALMANTDVVKVFHAARQDVEIFHHLGGVIPTPLFDTQVAAMVCGYGDQVGYETLARQLANATLDKSSRFTDWSRRPLTDKQLTYALGDVTHLRKIYEILSAKLHKSGRTHWVDEELAILSNPATYVTEPQDAWRRLKTRTSNTLFLAVVRELAAWREQSAQSRNVPRNRLIKDDALLEIAAARPKSAADISRLRLAQREIRKGPMADELIAAVIRAEALPASERPSPLAERHSSRPGNQALTDLLKVLLKARSEQTGVASKLIASAADLEKLSSGEYDDARVLTGWRREVFGEDARKLTNGEIALSAGPKGVRIITLDLEEPEPRKVAGSISG